MDGGERERIRMEALRRLERRGHSRRELIERLVAAGFDAGLVEAVTSDLLRVGLLDDEAYGRDVAQRVASRGPVTAEWVRLHLEARGIDEPQAAELASEATAGRDPVEVAVGYLQQRRRVQPRLDPDAARRRWGNALARRGFDPDIIGEALARVGLAEESDG